MKERENKVLAMLMMEESVSGHSIEETFGISRAARTLFMNRLMKKHKEIQNLSPRGVAAEYKWVPDKPKVESFDFPTDPAPVAAAPLLLGNHTTTTRDAEAMAMTAVLKATEKTGKILPGEVWQTEESNGNKGMIFALNSLNGACQGIKLYPDSEETRTIVGENPFSVDILGKTYLGDPTHVTFKPLKYCIRRRMFTHVNKLNEAKEALIKVFGIDIPKPTVVNAKPEVRIVYRDRPEKKEEKPVIPDNYIDARSAYIAHLETERDIWKEVAMKLLDKNS